MPRQRFQTLTEQMFYILMAQKEECCGTDIMERVRTITDGAVQIGPGTLYNLLEQFQEEGMIRQTRVEGRRRSYILTDHGAAVLEQEYRRIQNQAELYRRYF